MQCIYKSSMFCGLSTVNVSLSFPSGNTDRLKFDNCFPRSQSTLVLITLWSGARQAFQNAEPNC